MLELRNINKGFGEKQILSNFSLKIPEKQNLGYRWDFWWR